MSKKPRKSRHRVPILKMTSDPISERYQTEVDMSTTRLERRYARALKALRTAEHKAEQARRSLDKSRPGDRTAKRDHDRLQLLVEQRRAELREIEMLMIPESHTSRDGRRRKIRQETEAIIIPLGDTTGERKKLKIPIFPVTTDKVLK